MRSDKANKLPVGRNNSSLGLVRSMESTRAELGISRRYISHKVKEVINGVYSVFMSTDGTKLITGHRNNVAKLWDVETGECLMTYKGHLGEVRSAFLSDDNKYLVTCSTDGTAKLWDVETAQCLMTYKNYPDLWGWHYATRHSDWVYSAILTPDGARVITGSQDHTIRFWDTESGELLAILYNLNDGYLWTTPTRLGCCCTYSAILNNDATQLVAGSGDGIPKLWDVKAGQCLMTYRGHSAPVRSVFLSSDGMLLATGSNDKTAKLWNVETGECLMTYRDSDMVISVAMSSDSTRLVTTSGDNTARLWDVKTGKTLMTYTGHSNSITAVFLSSDGLYLATGSCDNTAKLWDVETGHCLMTFTGHSASIRSVFLNNDRTLLVTGSYDNTAKLWDVRTGHCLMTYTGHSGCVRSVYLNDDGTRLLTGSWDDTAKLWDVETGKCLMTYKGHSNAVSSAVLTPDGARVVTGSQDHTIRFWDTESGELLATFHNFYANENSYFYTNRPDLIDVIECDEKDEDNPRILPEDDIRRKAYLKAYNNWGKVRDRIFPPSPDSKATYRDIKDIIAMIKDKEIKRLQPPKWEQGLRRDT